MKAVRALVDGSPVPLVADIHFDHTLAIAAMENGIHKMRINPGNIGGATTSARWPTARRPIACPSASA